MAYLFLPNFASKSTEPVKSKLSIIIFDTLMEKPRISINELQDIIDEKYADSEMTTIHVLDVLLYMKNIEYLTEKGGKKYLATLNAKIGEASATRDRVNIFEMKEAYWERIYSSFFFLLLIVYFTFLESKEKQQKENENKIIREQIHTLEKNVIEYETNIDNALKNANDLSQKDDRLKGHLGTIIDILSMRSFADLQKEKQETLLDKSEKVKTTKDGATV